MEQFLRLKAKLAVPKGLFDPARRRLVPAFVRRIGWSPRRGRARAMINALARRAPQVEVILCPSRGAGAEAGAAGAAPSRRPGSRGRRAADRLPWRRLARGPGPSTTSGWCARSPPARCR